MNSTSDRLSFKDQFLAPLKDALSQSKHTRKCPTFSDEDWLLAGVQRSLKTFSSGRDFLQKIGMLSNGMSTYLLATYLKLYRVAELKLCRFLGGFSRFATL